MENQTPLEKFVNTKEGWDDKHIQLAQLYELKLIHKKLERNRSNTSTLVWWLIAFPLITMLLILGFGLGSFT
ncbi:hypothetical protein [Maribacter sp. 4G9]|uniref:hypothetical protein n=1 Tax=Maribacter sp. 4G9 TaxID=1889777 RepID=UPI000C152C8E|nr:hypothetical protein [Maribacter sp. 4G9]PIB38304.1 hypothetical protein BFP75_17110 [Maribacter sp. 4G9]